MNFSFLGRKKAVSNHFDSLFDAYVEEETKK